MTTIGDLYAQQVNHGNHMVRENRPNPNMQQVPVRQSRDLTQKELHYYQTYGHFPWEKETIQQENIKRDLDKIIDDINQENIPEENIHQKVTKQKKNKKKSSGKNNKENDKLINYLKEIGIIVAVYIILSLPEVKKTLSNSIPQLNKGSDGKYPFIALIIYGIIIGTVSVVLRKFILKN